MSQEYGIRIQDDTELASLMGEDQEYRRLVKRLFSSEEYGNLTWGAARASTYSDFFETLTIGQPAIVKIWLVGWINYYQLKNGFKSPVSGS